MDWNTATNAFRRQRAQRDGASTSLPMIQLARAVDAVEPGTVDVVDGDFSYRGDHPIAEDAVLRALRVPGVRVLRTVAGSGSTATGGGVNAVDLGGGWPDVLSARFVASDLLMLGGALLTRFAGTLDTLWQRAGQTGFWGQDQIERIRAVVAVGVAVVPTTSGDHPPGWTAERATSYAKLAGQFEGMAKLYMQGRMAEANAEAMRAANDRAFWDTVAFWEAAVPESTGEGSGGILAEWWSRVLGLWGSWFGKALILAILVAVGYVVFVNRKRFAQAAGRKVAGGGGGGDKAAKPAKPGAPGAAAVPVGGVHIHVAKG